MIRATDDHGRSQATTDDGAIDKANVVRRRPSSSLIALLTASLLAAAPATPDSRDGPGVDVLLEEMRSAYARIHMARMRFSEERPDVRTETVDGVLEWAGRGRLVAKLVMPDAGVVTIRANGSKIVTSRPHSNAWDVKPFHLRTLRALLPDDPGIAALFDWRRSLSTDHGGALRGAALTIHHDVEWNGRRWTVLKETGHATTVRVLVDPDTHLIWRTERVDRRTGHLVAAMTVEQLEVREWQHLATPNAASYIIRASP